VLIASGQLAASDTQVLREFCIETITLYGKTKVQVGVARNAVKAVGGVRDPKRARRAI
jgi:hypothetical protein